MLCNKITVIVNDLKKEHQNKIELVAVKVGSGNSAEEIKKANLKTHGIIAKDKAGKVIATVDGHSYGKAKILEVLAKLQK